MRQHRLLSVLSLTLLFAWAPRLVCPVTPVSAAQAQREKKEVAAWVNTRSGVYHCPGSRWYGNTKQGKYMSECEAQKEGYRPAYGRPCGSDCGNKIGQPTPPPQRSAPAGATAQCADGTYSFSQHRRGTCSHHGGVRKWLTPETK